MPRKQKEPVRPFFSVKFEFIDSLDALGHEGVNFLQSVETALDLSKGLEEPLRDRLRESAKSFREALIEKD